MNNPAIHPTRLVCRVARLWIALAGDSAPSHSSGWPRRHVDACSACRLHFAALDALDHALAADARAHRHAPPEGLEDAIMHALRRPVTRPRRPSPFVVLGGSLAGVAAVAAVALLMLRSPAALDMARTDPAKAAAEFVASMPTTVAAMETASVKLWQTIDRSTNTLAQDDPLLGEVDRVYADARSALRFLATNFLPGGGMTEEETSIPPQSS